MLIEEKSLNHWINNFYGYGSWDARMWFIGYEEGGGELPEEVAERVNYFYQVHLPTTGGNICDIREFYKHVAPSAPSPGSGAADRVRKFTSLYDYRFGSNAIQHGVWKNLISFVHGYRNEKLPDLLAYQKHNFLSPFAHSEALIQLYPLPSPHNHAWYYSWLDLPQLRFLKSRTLYQEHVYLNRMHSILSNIRAYKPEVVLMYGMDNINKLKKSVQDFFDGAKFKMIKATIPPARYLSGSYQETIGRQTPQHHRGEFNGTTMLITTQIPALRHNRIETGFDWEQFGKSVKSGNQ